MQGRLAILLVFPVGWLVTVNSFDEFILLYTALTFISFLFSFFILTNLEEDFKKEIHLWVIFLIFLIGYYVKFYMLVYLNSLNRIFFETLSPLAPDLLSSPKILMKTYELVTLALFAFSVVIALIRLERTKPQNLKDPMMNGVSPEIKVHSVSKKQIRRLMSVSIIFSILILSLISYLGIGVVSSETSANIILPFKLAGLLQYGRGEFVPMLFLFSIWLAEEYNDSWSMKTGVFSYLLFGVLSSILTTSKAPLILVLLSLVVLWILTGRFTRVRCNIILALVPFMLLMNGILMTSRIIINANNDISPLASLPLAFSALFEFNGLTNVFYQTGFSFLMRVNGIDPLLNIAEYNPLFSISRIYSILVESPLNVDRLYSLKVLGLSDWPITEHSASLLGFFYFVTGDQLMTAFSVIFYTLFWHILFRNISYMSFIIKPVSLAILVPLLAQYTSEGTLQSLPFNLFRLFIMFVLVETLARFIMPQIYFHEG